MNKLMILTLLNIPRVGRKTINIIKNQIKLINVNESEIRDILIDAKCRNKNITIPTSDQVKYAIVKAEEIIKKSEEDNIKCITILDKLFPEKLLNIDDPPVIIFYKGNKRCITEERAVAIIGTRKPTMKGIEISEKLGEVFSSFGYIIISGLARGCDEYSHKGCVKLAGKSIGVMPRGLDSIYPSYNKRLAELILENNGCLLSEYSIGVSVYKNSLIERDRLQSALAQAVIIVESDEISGSMHTAEYALKQNKILACYSHSKEFLGLKQTRGNKKLIEDGKAIGIYTKNDIENLKRLIEKRIECKINKNMVSLNNGIQMKLI